MDKAERLKEIQDIAIRNGGTCLSSEYTHSHGHLIFNCNQGHIWNATPTNIKRGKWCKKCSRVRGGLKKRLGIKRMRQIASERGGKCLSKSYENSQKSLLWRCSKGHTWFAKPNNIITLKTWCPHCAGQRVTVEKLNSFAKKKGGECLSSKYKNSKIKIEWKCARGHSFKMDADHAVNSNNWCPICAGNAPLSFKDAIAAAKRHNGKCLSAPEEFSNSMGRLEWQCADGHEWSATLNNVRNGRWCPHCVNSIGESLTRQVLEHIFGATFKKGRHNWLPSPVTGNPMELDGFNESLKIAFEYQGPHHYDPANSYIKNREHVFEKVRFYDAEKARICSERKVKLILIYKFDPFRNDEKIALTVYEAVRLVFPKLGYDPLTFRSTAVRKSRLSQFAEEAKRRGGELLSPKYIGMNGKLLWQCAKGHMWSAVPSAVITRGTWCARCKRGRKTKTL